MLTFTKFTFARQFLLLSLAILVAGLTIIGVWIQERIEHAVTNRTAAVTALYVDSFITPYMQSLLDSDGLSESDLLALDRLLTETALGQQIVSFKIWSPEGQILYSPNPELVGRSFVISDDLSQAFGGDVTSHLTDLNEAENTFESRHWDSLIETYAPIRLGTDGRVMAVSEFYQLPDALLLEIRLAQQQSWLVVSLSTLIMYLLLVGMVARASNLIMTQQTTLREQVVQLNAMLRQNRSLQRRIQSAAVRTTSLNEQFLWRVSADLHDGPAQYLALALLRMGALASVCETCLMVKEDRQVVDDLKIVQDALSSALADIRAIAEGLQPPEVEDLSVEETARQVVRDYRRLSGKEIVLNTSRLPHDAPLPVRLTLYRLLQEALSNGLRHTNGAIQVVELSGKGNDLWVQIQDSGQGFSLEEAAGHKSLGLTGMRERVELLGGEFLVDSIPGRGTMIKACLPLSPLGDEHD